MGLRLNDKKIGLLVGFVLAGVMAWGPGTAQAAEPLVAAGLKVAFDYTLTIEGQVVDSSEGKVPLEYVHGQGQIIPGLAAQLQGMKAGEAKTVVVAPADGYGDPNPELIQPVARTHFPEDFTPQVGMILELTNDQGQGAPGVVREITDGDVVMDFNHPLAGQELTFAVKIVSITPTEGPSETP